MSIVTIQKIKDGKTTHSHCPESQLDKVLEHFRNSGYLVEVVTPEPQASRFISLDEQRATKTAIEEEQHHSRFCPDCGREMEYDGVWYCEYCEG